MTTITKTQTAKPVGTYIPTALDTRKAAADILLTAVGPSGAYSVSSKVDLSGRGIKSYGNGNYLVSDAALTKLRASHSVECDF